MLYRQKLYRLPLTTDNSSAWQEALLCTLTVVACAYVDLQVQRSSSTFPLFIDDDHSESNSSDIDSGDEDDDDHPNGHTRSDIPVNSASSVTDPSVDCTDAATDPSDSPTAEPSAPSKEKTQDVAEAIQDDSPSSLSTSVPASGSPSSASGSEEEVQAVVAPETVTFSHEQEDLAASKELSSSPVLFPPLSKSNDVLEPAEESGDIDPPVEAPTDLNKDVADNVLSVSKEPTAFSDPPVLHESGQHDGYVLVPPSSGPPEDPVSCLPNHANIDAVQVDGPLVARCSPAESPAPKSERHFDFALNHVAADVDEAGETFATSPSPAALPVSPNSASVLYAITGNAQLAVAHDGTTDAAADVASSDDGTWQLVEGKNKRKGKGRDVQGSTSGATDSTTSPSADHSHTSRPSAGSRPLVAPSNGSITEKVRNRRGRKGKGKLQSRDPQPLIAAHRPLPPVPPPPRTFAPIKPAGYAWGLAQPYGSVKNMEVDQETVDSIAQHASIPDHAPADTEMASAEPAVNVPSVCQLAELNSIVAQAIAQAQVVKTPETDLASSAYQAVLYSISDRGTAPMDIDIASAQSATPPAAAIPVFDSAPPADTDMAGPILNRGTAPMEINQVPLQSTTVSVPVSDFAPEIDNAVKSFSIRGTAPPDINQVPNRAATAYRFSTLPEQSASQPTPTNTGIGDVASSGKSMGNGKKQRVNGLATSRHAPEHQPVASASSPSAVKRPASPSFVVGKNADKNNGKEIIAPDILEVSGRKRRHDARRLEQKMKKRGKPKDASTVNPVQKGALSGSSGVEMPDAPGAEVARETDNGKLQKLAQAAMTSDDECCIVDNEL